MLNYLSQTIETVRKQWQQAPLLVTEESACKCITYITGVQEVTLTDYLDRWITDCLIYNCTDKKRKKHSVEEIRKFIPFLYEKPAHDILLVIFHELHLLSEPAQNALLKIFEDIPTNVLILITSTAPNRIITTLLSRIIILEQDRQNPEEDQIAHLINSWIDGDVAPLIQFTFEKDFRKEQALHIVQSLQNAILRGKISPSHSHLVSTTQKTLETTNTIPRYIIHSLLTSLLCEKSGLSISSS